MAPITMIKLSSVIELESTEMSSPVVLVEPEVAVISYSHFSPHQK